jgi:PD-(D/E)XK endonuclease
MASEHPKRKGAIGEGIVILELLRAGIPVFQEFGDLRRVDLIALIGDKPIKIQVKTTTSKKGAALLNLRKMTLNPKYNYTYRQDDVDVFALVVEDQRKVFYVRAEQALQNKGTLTIRLEQARNNQQSLVNRGEDYTLSRLLRDYTPDTLTPSRRKG